MNIPGFTAEASLYRTSEHYHLMTNPRRSDEGVHPAFDPTQFASFTFARCLPSFKFVPLCVEFYAGSIEECKRYIYIPVFQGFNCN